MTKYLPVLFLVFISFAPSVARATATFADCDPADAPNDFNDEACTPSGGLLNMCYQDGSDVICDMERFDECLSNGNFIKAVASFGTSSHDFTAWGECDGINWCCVVDDVDSEITQFVLQGTDFDEELMSLTEGSDDMEAHRALDQFFGRVEGRQGNDLIFGSNTQSADYDDKLFGMNGADEIQGNNGRDYINGGFGPDNLIGGQGNDRIVAGGSSGDTLDGGDGIDTLCANAKTGGVCNAPELTGGPGKDVLWVSFDVSCTGAGDDPTFLPGAFVTNQECGDNDWDGLVPGFPAGCDDQIGAEPATCAEPTF